MKIISWPTSFIPANITDPYYKNQLETFGQLHKTLMLYYYGGNKKVVMPQNLKNQLIAIAYGCNGYASIKARAVLSDLFGMSFADYVSCNLYPTLIFKEETSPRLKASSDFTIMPNPVANILEILNNNIDQDATYEVSIVDMLGKQAYIGKLTGYVTRIDVTKWTPGIYTYFISSDGKMKAHAKIIKID